MFRTTHYSQYYPIGTFDWLLVEMIIHEIDQFKVQFVLFANVSPD